MKINLFRGCFPTACETTPSYEGNSMKWCFCLTHFNSSDFSLSHPLRWDRRSHLWLLCVSVGNVFSWTEVIHLSGLPQLPIPLKRYDLDDRLLIMYMQSNSCLVNVIGYSVLCNIAEITTAMPNFVGLISLYLCNNRSFMEIKLPHLHILPWDTELAFVLY